MWIYIQLEMFPVEVLCSKGTREDNEMVINGCAGVLYCLVVTGTWVICSQGCL